MTLAPGTRLGAYEVIAQVSPESHWLAYMSDVTGTAEVYGRRLAADGTVSDATGRPATIVLNWLVGSKR